MMKVNEIFTSVQGEGSHAGHLCTFVRFTACNLRCRYCDTEYAFYEGDNWERHLLVDAVMEPGVSLVCVTGGEPLLQKELPQFCEDLHHRGAKILLETGGSRCLAAIPESVVKVVDVKTPGALLPEGYNGGEVPDSFVKTHFHYPNLECLNPGDEVKFVVTSRADFDWTVDFVETHKLHQRSLELLISPCHGEVAPADLVDWMKESSFPGRLNLQLHKYIWGKDVRGV